MTATIAPQSGTATTQNTPTMRVIAAGIRANIPVLVEGNPGVGKTAALTNLGRQNGFHTEQIIGSIREASDFLGLPIEQDGSMRYAAPEWAVRLAQSTKGLLYLGELTTTSPSTMRAMLRLIQERYAGDVHLGPHVSIIADCNPASVAVDGYDLPAPIANRFMHVSWVVNTDDWFDGAMSGFADHRAPLITELTVDNERRRTKARMQVLGYLRSAQQFLDPGVPEDPEQAGKGWPSPRSWTNAMNVLGYLDENDTEACLLAVTGCVGRGSALEFMRWAQSADLHDPFEVLRDPSIVDWSNERPDRLYVLMTAIASIATSDQRQWRKAAKVIALCARNNRPDVALPAASKLVSIEGADLSGLSEDDAMAFADMFRASNRWSS